MCVSYICVYVFYKTYFSTLLIFSYIPIHLLSRQNSTQAHTLNHTATFHNYYFPASSIANYFSPFPSISFNILPPFSPCSLITVIWKTIEVYKRHPLMTVNALKNGCYYISEYIFNIFIIFNIFEEKTSIYSFSGVALYINNKKKRKEKRKK